MASSRDSSVWKSLAVAFGDGLVFAAGMKLAQRSARPAPAATPAPVALPAPFDRKLLEAVVSAVDERLKEHAEQVERRIAELEDRMNQRDEAVASAVEELRALCQTRIAELREELTGPGEASRDLLMAIGRTCIDAAGRVTPPASEPEPEPEHAAFRSGLQ
jgi:uncharacterized membrane protein YccC